MNMLSAYLQPPLPTSSPISQHKPVTTATTIYFPLFCFPHSRLLMSGSKEATPGSLPRLHWSRAPLSVAQRISRPGLLPWPRAHQGLMPVVFRYLPLPAPATHTPVHGAPDLPLGLTTQGPRSWGRGCQVLEARLGDGFPTEKGIR